MLEVKDYLRSHAVRVCTAWVCYRSPEISVILSECWQKLCRVSTAANVQSA